MQMAFFESSSLCRIPHRKIPSKPELQTLYFFILILLITASFSQLTFLKTKFTFVLFFTNLPFGHIHTQAHDNHQFHFRLEPLLVVALHVASLALQFLHLGELIFW